MKKIIILCIALFTLLSAKSQVVNVCGSDTIILSVDNYVNGIIEWQQSLDTLNWVTIPEAYGTTYKFYPTETKYYRAVVKTSTCTPLFSAISFVQLAPNANAGGDRVVGGTTTILLGNKVTGATGLWTILSGTDGVLLESTNPYSEFKGIYNQVYELVWSVTNGCSQSKDTVKVIFEEIVAKNNFIVVDNTDTLYSDSTEMDTGTYRIKFSDSSIAPYDSVMLIGIRDSVSFLRKVVAFTLQDSIYQFTTIPGSLKDLFKSGTVTLGDAINQSYLKGSSGVNGSKVRSINSFPTRQTIKQYADNKETFTIYSSEGSINSTPQKVKSVAEEDNPKIAFDFPQKFTFEAANGALKLTLEDFKLSLTPNFVLNYSFNSSALAFDKFKFGLENGLFDLGYKLKIEATDKILKKDEPYEITDLMKPLKKFIAIMVGPVPIPTALTLKVNGSLNMAIETAITVIENYNYNNKFSAIIYSENAEMPKLDFKTVENSTSNWDLSINGGLNGEFKVGPELSFKFADIIGPYVNLPIKLGLELKANTNLNWSGEASFGLEGLIGVKAETDALKIGKKTIIDSYTFFDYNFSLWGDNLTKKDKFPYKIELLSGNNQQGQPEVVLPKPIVFKVTDYFGIPTPFVRVRFELDNGNGNVDENVLVTDISGQVSLNWTLGSNAVNVLKASVLDFENQNIENSPLKVNAYTISDYKGCENSNLSITIKSTQTSKYPLVSGGVPPYSYSTNGINYSTQIPYFDLSTPGNFVVSVKDNNQCCVVKWIVISATNPCTNTDLTMDAIILSNTLQISGKKGTAPYLYAIDNQSNYTVNNFFTNLSAGYHLVFVKDAKGCTVSNNVQVNLNTQAAIKASYPLDGATSIPITNVKLQWSSAKYTENQYYEISLQQPIDEPPFGPLYESDDVDKSLPFLNLGNILSYNKNYKWKVIVRSPSGIELDSREFTFTTAISNNMIPTIPTLISPLNNSFNQSLPITLKWEKQEGDFLYDVYLDSSNGTQLIANNLTDTSFTINNLNSNTLYYWKIKIKNKISGLYKESVVSNFKTEEIVTDIDGNKYHTVTIGNQIWLVENLKTTKYQNGESIGTTISTTMDISKESNPKYQWAYNGDITNTSKYGRLYTYYTVVDKRNIAPVGWHVASDLEFNILMNFLIKNGFNYDGSTTYNRIAKSLAATTAWSQETDIGMIGSDLTKNNLSGFTGLPSGFRYNTGAFFAQTYSAYFWCSSDDYSSDARYWFLSFGWESFSKSMKNKSFGLSVRCLKN